MALEAITDHASLALSRVRLQFRNSADILGTVGALTAEVQALEDAFIQANAVTRDHTTATGQTLDLIAKLVAAPSRGTRSDLEFRSVIRATIVRNKSFGRLDDLVAICAELLVSIGLWQATQVVDAGDAGVSTVTGQVGGDQCAVVESTHSYDVAAFSDAISFAKMQEVEGFLKAVGPAGVRVILVSVVSPTAGYALFGFDGITRQPLDVGTFLTAIDRV